VGRRLALITILTVFLPAAAPASDLPGQPRVDLNAPDNQRAQSAVIRLSDLRPAPFRIDKKGRGVPMIPNCSNPRYPGDRSATTVTGLASSSFTDGFDLMGSHTIFFKSQFDALEYWKQTALPGFATCEASLLKRQLKPGASAKTLFARQLPIERTGADDAAVYRTITRMKARNSRAYNWYQTTVFVRVARSVAIAKIAYVNQPCDCYPTIARVLASRLTDASHR
jgi:hypothetical protein